MLTFANVFIKSISKYFKNFFEIYNYWSQYIKFIYWLYSSDVNVKDNDLFANELTHALVLIGNLKLILTAQNCCTNSFHQEDFCLMRVTGICFAIHHYASWFLIVCNKLHEQHRLLIRGYVSKCKAQSHLSCSGAA